MKVLKGKSVAPGFATGRAFVCKARPSVPVPRYRLKPAEVDHEYRRFQQAVECAARELQVMYGQVHSDLGQPEAQIFDAHLALLLDRQFAEQVKARISSDLVNVEQAVETEINSLVRILEEVDDSYLSERATDIRDVGERVLEQLVREPRAFLAGLEPETVLVVEELLPSDTLKLDREHVVAIVTERGGSTGHAAILARSMAIPAVTGVENATRQIASGSRLLVDGERAEVILLPTAVQRERFDQRMSQYRRASEDAVDAELQVCATRDGQEITLLANIGQPDEARQVARHNLDGVGLFRTEFLFLDDVRPPDLERQLKCYQHACRTLGDRPLVIRTLDLGGDKHPVFLAGPQEANPNLGLRGLRFSLESARYLFETQLRAILQCAEQGDVRVMFPMVLGADDFQQAKCMVNELSARYAGSAGDIPVGAMIETPSALFTIEEILSEADFLSLGTNDLTQFMLAADRNATAVMEDYSTLHPAVLRAIRQVVEAAAAHGKPLSVCGEAAGDPTIASLLVGMGIRSLSMSPSRAARVRYQLRHSRADSLAALAREALQCKSIDEVKGLVQSGINLAADAV
jgi:phosphoenolpyruvate-protein phosphotransferase (PTS system enzyme I)